LFVAEINHAVMPLAWLLARRHRLLILFDPFVSRYDSLVLDRKQIAQRSWRAGYLYWSDRISMNLADHVLADTHQHRLYYQEKLRVIRPITVVPIGANPQIFHPVSNAAQVTKKKSSPFQVVFWGKFIPLQGVQYILQAAHILEQQVAPVRFSIYGSGQTFAEMQRLARELNLTNVTFYGFIPVEQFDQVLQEFRKVKNELTNEGATEVHLFYKGPVTLAMALGALFSDWVPIKVYAFVDGVYRLQITLDRRMVRGS